MRSRRGRSEGLSVGGQEAVALDHHVVSKALEKADAYGSVTSDGCDLLLAFLAAFLAQIAELRECDAQQLNDNGSIDVRLIVALANAPPLMTFNIPKMVFCI